MISDAYFHKRLDESTENQHLYLSSKPYSNLMCKLFHMHVNSVGAVRNYFKWFPCIPKNGHF